MKPVLVQSFAPVADRRAEILILGSMPGRDSLAAGQYYAHPHNLFWKIMAAMLGFEPQTPYHDRLNALRAARIALWDVMHSCKRAGSLDASIEASTIKANDFPSFLGSHKRIGHVFFNGSVAEATYVRHVLPSVASLGLRYARLPSTSPAHAALSYRQKLAAWRAVLKGRPHERGALARRAV